MIETMAPQTELEQACAEAVDSLLARHAWRLLPRPEFVRRAADALLSGNATEPARAAVHIYSLALYDACSGREGERRQDLAYHELFHYLFRSAYHQYGPQAEDITQQAIERVLANFSRCRVPAAFLAWAFQQLRDAARTWRRAAERDGGDSLDEPFGEGPDTLAVVLPDTRTPGPEQQALARENRERLERLVRDFLARYPRSRRQLEALLLKHLWGLDDTAVSKRMGTPVKSVYVLRSRARKKLQEDPAWQALARELDLL